MVVRRSNVACSSKSESAPPSMPATAAPPEILTDACDQKDGSTETIWRGVFLDMIYVFREVVDTSHLPVSIFDLYIHSYDQT